MNDDESRPRWSDEDVEGERRDDPEGVRIIGADEAERALEREDVARRRGPDDPRPGDRPGRPPADAPEPVLRFPLSSSAGDAEEPELPHWSDPPTGEFDQVGGTLFDTEPGGDEPSGEWSALSSGAPRWRDSGDPWSEEEDVRAFGDDDTRIGALDESERPDPEDFFRFDDLDQPPPGRSVFSDAEPDEYYAEDAELEPDPYDDEGARKIVVGGGRVRPGDPAGRQPAMGVGSDRDIRQAVLVGVGLIALAGVLFLLGPPWAAALVVVVVTLTSVELYAKLQEVGYQPASLLGIVGTAGVVFGAYHRGESAIPVAIFLLLVFSMLWFYVGAGHLQATLNIGVTLLGFVWIGVFGSFAAALLAVQGGTGVGDAGKGILFGAIIATVGYDVGGYFVGRSVGHSHFSDASPNKTIEGLIGGMIAAITIALIYGFLSEPFGSPMDGLTLGITVAIAAPLGDLCQSMIKRDLGIKDMGTVLPGHGGFLDRFDGLLFVLPAVYFAAKLSDFFL